MRIVTAILSLLLAVPAYSQNVSYYPNPGTLPIGSNLTTTASYSANIAPALAAANWTCGSGWDCSVAGTLDKNAAGVGTAVPNPALTITAGTTYKVTITVGALTVASGATWTLGGTTGIALTAVTTYTDYIVAASTANLIITPTPTTTRFTITSVIIEPITASTGTATFDGLVTLRSPLLLSNGLYGAAFASDVDTGIGWGGSGILAFRGNGTLITQLSSSGLIGGASDTFDFGSTFNYWRSLYLSRGIQGAKTKALTDAAAAVSVWSCAIPTSDYLGGDLIWSAKSTDATDFRLTQGTIRFAGINKAGTTTCTIGVIGTDLTASSNGNTLVCTWTNVASTTNCLLSATCTDNTGGSQTMVMNSRLNMPIPQTCTPQ